MNDWQECLGQADRDKVVACADLVGRSGARQFQIGYLNDEPPHAWYAHAMFRGARIQAEGHDGPAQAAMALAVKILTGAKCRCGRLVALRPSGAVAFRKTRMADGTEWSAAEAAKAGQCRWRLIGDKWEPSCPVSADRKVGPL